MTRKRDAISQSGSFETPARRSLAQLGRRLAAGRVTNDQFEDAAMCAGPATRACYFEYFWFLYSDLREHTLSLSREQKREVARVLLFLYSGQAYQWPARSLRLRVIARWLDCVTLGFSRRYTRGAQERRLRSRGYDPAFWPFKNAGTFAQARKHPPLLCGEP